MIDENGILLNSFSLISVVPFLYSCVIIYLTLLQCTFVLLKILLLEFVFISCRMQRWSQFSCVLRGALGSCSGCPIHDFPAFTSWGQGLQGNGTMLGFQSCCLAKGFDTDLSLPKISSQGSLIFPLISLMLRFCILSRDVCV